jgi:hypothetical protein
VERREERSSKLVLCKVFLEREEGTRPGNAVHRGGDAPPAGEVERDREQSPPPRALTDGRKRIGAAYLLRQQICHPIPVTGPKYV